MKTYQYILTLVALLFLLLVCLNGRAILQQKIAEQQAAHPSSVVPATSEVLVTTPDAEEVFSAAGGTIPVAGQAVGSWYFEASFPITLLDQHRKVIGSTNGQAQGDWMSKGMVPFTATLTYPAQAPNSAGFVVIHNDNPSGDPARDKSVEIPIVFK